MPSVPVLSLTVAALAVILTPFVTWLVTRMQIASAQRIAVRQVVAPMRQAWINQLRKLIAELLTRTRLYLFTRPHPDDIKDFDIKDFEPIQALYEEIELMLNPTEPQHQELAAAVKHLTDTILPGRTFDFGPANEHVRDLTRTILKAEWNRTKAGD